MTVSSAVRKAGPFNGNGVTTVFPFSFKVFDKTNVSVVFANALGVGSTLTLDSDYSVTLNADQNNNPGGSITYPITGLPLAQSYTLTLLGALAYTQPTDITNSGGFYPSIIEDALDRAEIQIQQLAEIGTRAIQVPPADGSTSVLPAAGARAGTVIGFDSNGNLVLLPVPASVGAGDLRTDTFISSLLPNPLGWPTFVAGTTTSLTLSRAPGTIDNTVTHFDAGYQGKDQVSTLVGAVLTYTAPIPVGTERVYVTTGTTLSVNYPGTNEANVLDFGADLTGATDSTGAFLAAIGTGKPVVAPEGIFKTGAITWPSGSRFRGMGNGTLIVPVAGFSALAFWSTQNAGSDIELHNFAMNLPVATFPNSVPLFCNPGDRIYVHDLYIQEGGTIGLYSNGLTNSIQERVVVQKAATVGIIMQTGADCTIRDCAVSNIAQSHGISVQDSSTVIVSECRASTVGGFGITMQRCVNSQINSSRTHNSTLEGITAGGDGGDNVDVYGNLCTWDSGVSQDFGMSIAANGNGGTFRIRFRGNTIRGCGKSGIALAGDSTAGWSVLSCEVSENTIIDSNQLGLGPVNGGGAGVILYGSFCTGHRVANNTFIDSGGGKLNYGVFETQIGAGGFPSRNTFFNNSTYGQSGARVNKQGNSAEAFCQDPEQPYLSWAPATGAGSGALSAVTTLAAFYIEKQAEVDFYAEFQITNNGSAASTFTFTLPFTAAFGMGTGRENVLTGAGLVVSIAGNVATVRTVGNAYPGGTNAVIEVSGKFVRTF